MTTLLPANTNQSYKELSNSVNTTGRPAHKTSIRRKEETAEEWNLEITELIESRYRHIKQVLNVTLAENLAQRTSRYLELQKLNSNILSYIQLCSMRNKKVSKKMVHHVLKEFNEIEQKITTSTIGQKRSTNIFLYPVRLLENFDFYVTSLVQTSWRKLSTSL